MTIRQVKTDIYSRIVEKYKVLFHSNDRVLGVMLRGTDYASMRPKNHSVVSPISYAIKKIEILFSKWNCNKIFLVTEDEKIAQDVRSYFGDICIINDQDYINYDGKHKLNYYASGKKDDIIRNGLSYLTGCVILSKCQCFATVGCSGSVAVMMMADHFEHVYRFNFGRYGTQSENFKGNHDVYDGKYDEVYDLLESEREPILEYRVHASNVGWMLKEKEGACAGDKRNSIEAFEIYCSNEFFKIFYSCYSNGKWNEEVSTGSVAGTTGKRTPLHGICLRLDEKCYSYSIYYRVWFSDGLGWSYWEKDGGKIFDDTHSVMGVQIKILSKRSEIYKKQSIINGGMRLLPAIKNEMHNAVEKILLDESSFMSRMSWLEKYRIVESETDWLVKKPILGGHDSEVVYAYLYLLLRLLKEYHPKNILEFNFGQTTKILAQYASANSAKHTVLDHDRSRIEHFMHCWNINWTGTTIHGSQLRKAESREMRGWWYGNFAKVTEGQKYSLILLKCPFGGADVSGHIWMCLQGCLIFLQVILPY